MRVWLLQQAEPTPHDDKRSQRLLRTGILADRLVRSGHEVVWWTSTFDHHNRRQRYPRDCSVPVGPGYDIQYLYGPSYRRVYSPSRALNHRSVARRFAAVAAATDAIPDVIVTSMPTVELALSAVRFGRRIGVPVVLDIRDLWPDVFFDVLPALLKPVLSIPAMLMRRSLRKAARDATAIVGLTDGFVEWGLGYAGRERGSLDRVFFMAYPEKKRPSGDLSSAGLFWDDFGVREDLSTLTVAFVGTLGLTVDFAPVVQAAKILHDEGTPARFVVCGDGARKTRIEQQAAGVPNIFFPGWIHEARIHALLDRSDIGLIPYIPSPNYILNLPNKPAEYMAGGLAIANSLDSGELFNLITARECGFSYAGRGAELAEQLTRLVEDPARLAALKANARTTFSELLRGESVYGEMVAYLEGIVGNHKRSGKIQEVS